MKWRGAVDRAVAPLGPTHAQHSVLASLYGTQRGGGGPAGAASPTTRAGAAAGVLTLITRRAEAGPAALSG